MRLQSCAKSNFDHKYRVHSISNILNIRQSWRGKRNAKGKELKLHQIGGASVDGPGYEPNINPSDTNDVVDLFAQGSAEIVGQAVEAAKAVFPRWSRTPLQERSERLQAVANLIQARREGLADLLAREEGKPLAEARGEVTRAAQIFRFFAGEIFRSSGEVFDSIRPGIGIEVTREPVGVVGLITPWNFPIAIPAWKIAPAIAFGNTVVFKPSELVPGSAHALLDILGHAELPAGVVNLVMGRGPVVGAAMARHADIDALSFTGSVATGRSIQQAAIESGKRLQLEMGGKNPLVVLDDADLATAVEVAVNGAFYSTGQRCTASSRLIVTQGIHDRFVAAVNERISKLRVGDARDPETEMGPVVDAGQLEKNVTSLSRAIAEGGQAVGGEILQRDKPGFYLSPALITGTHADHWINRTEIFGPIASVICVRNYEEAVDVANQTEFGLSAGICTSSLRHAQDFKRRAEAGMVMVNLPTAGVDFHVPFGGRKQSSFGPREQGGYARDFYTNVKTSYTLP